MWVYKFMRSKLDQMQTFVIDLVFNVWDRANVFNNQVKKPILPQHNQQSDLAYSRADLNEINTV